MTALGLKGIANRVSMISFVLGILLCLAYFFDKDVEVGTLLYFYVLLAGVVTSLVVVSLIVGSIKFGNERRVLFYTLAYVLALYALLFFVFYLTDEFVGPITKYAK